MTCFPGYIRICDTLLHELGGEYNLHGLIVFRRFIMKHPFFILSFLTQISLPTNILGGNSVNTH